MKYLFALLLFSPVLLAQPPILEQTVRAKVMMIQQFADRGEAGETAFWQTKGKVTFAIVNYTDAQNPVFRDLFIAQYREILPLYYKMGETSHIDDSRAFLLMLMKHEQAYRDLLTPEQLKAYRAQLSEFEATNPEQAKAYNSLFFSDEMLELFKKHI